MKLRTLFHLLSKTSSSEAATPPAPERAFTEIFFLREISTEYSGATWSLVSCRLVPSFGFIWSLVSCRLVPSFSLCFSRDSVVPSFSVLSNQSKLIARIVHLYRPPLLSSTVLINPNSCNRFKALYPFLDMLLNLYPAPCRILAIPYSISIV